ncbi:hypothetical protein GWO43_29470 [candidate division KSB1 bacterium]|nr:hypothetical protein [candidate division KSB1 bacterium]NIR69892.1 hypothetical protein [candidate division KSB1 bacterium]NIS28045.1 hypothetical protein [candidate division KSB1 bacterium]NIT74916.1 hypothetical protein [candidate division KSB1 bacterium]NIU28700.1 hypothetical protein [candidate division KSB1 bacterium]
MKNDNIDEFLENQSLKDEFKMRNLDLSQVFCETPDNLQRENNVLRNLLDWVQKYSECRDRKEMEAAGYDFPPIDPGISPDNDWHRFELWMQGKPLRKRLKDRLPPGFIPTPPDELTDDELLLELEKLIEMLAEIHVAVDLVNDVPPRLLYEYLLESLEDEFDVIAEGFWHLDGCSGYCPGCFQRPWCEVGNASCWPEDEEAEKMFLIDSVKKYVSPSPVSLQILKKLQEEEDREFDEFRKTQGGRGIDIDPNPFDTDDVDDLPF